MHTYGVNVWLHWQATTESLGKLANRAFPGCWGKKDALKHGHCFMVSTESGDRVVFVAMRGRWRGEADQHAILAHECFHAVEFILEAMGLPHHRRASEAWAYLLSSLVRRCLEHLEPPRRRR